MIMREETPKDYDEVYEMVKASFLTTPDHDREWDYLNEVRKKDTFISKLSLVAESEKGKIIGQIVLYKADIITQEKIYTELVLSPISVHPDYFNQGIATKMMKKAFEIAKDMGYKAVFLCGDPNFYSKLGFKPSYEYKIFHITDKDKNAEWCMALELTNGALKNINGTIDIL